VKRLALFASFSGAGGVERMLMNLLREFARHDLQLDLVTLRADSVHLTQIPAAVRVIPLHANHSLTGIPALARYLHREHPDALLAAKDRAGRAALLARKLARVDTRIAIRLGTNLSTALADKSPLQRWARTAPMRWIYPLTEQVIAVSEGVADDTHYITGLARSRIRVIRNPVVTPQLQQQAQAAAPHPWLNPDRELPVVIGAGRLTRQKDFPTLLRAFARLTKQLPARLIILGDGRQREQLSSLACELGIGGVLLMPGFQSNPYAWLARADLFVLSSLWEGSPNVLAEALALGVPVVATRCPSGPDEILDQGRVAPLVAMSDPQALATAMQQQLEHPVDSDTLRAAVREYHAEISAEHYLDALGL